MSDRAVHRELPKQPGEQVRIPGYDFSAQVEAGESVSSATVTIKEKIIGTDRTSTMLHGSPSINGNVVSFVVKAGDHNLDYFAIIVATTNIGRILHAEIPFGVRERPF